MKEKISEQTKDAVIQFRKLEDSNKLYFMSVILNHLTNGLINDGNYLDSDTAYDNNKLVLDSNSINFDDPMKLATELLILAAKKENITLDLNGIDIEPYIKNKKSIEPGLSSFYKLKLYDKIDFLMETLYDISEIDEVEKTEFDFNELIHELLTYQDEYFGVDEENATMLET